MTVSGLGLMGVPQARGTTYADKEFNLGDVIVGIYKSARAKFYNTRRL